MTLASIRIHYIDLKCIETIDFKEHVNIKGRKIQGSEDVTLKIVQQLFKRKVSTTGAIKLIVVRN